MDWLWVPSLEDGSIVPEAEEEECLGADSHVSDTELVAPNSLKGNEEVKLEPFEVSNAADTLSY